MPHRPRRWARIYARSIFDSAKQIVVTIDGYQESVGVRVLLAVVEWDRISSFTRLEALNPDRFGSQLFQQFARFHAHIDGTGMGLYLVNRIVESHGGRLEVASVVDAGTTFTLYL